MATMRLPSARGEKEKEKETSLATHLLSSIQPVTPPHSQGLTISVPEAPAPTQSPSYPTQALPLQLTATSPPPSPEKRFFEKHNIMKWVIDDQDDGDIPGLSSDNPTESLRSDIFVKFIKKYKYLLSGKVQ